MNVPDEKVTDTIQQKAKKLREDWTALLGELQKANANDAAIEELGGVIERTLSIALKSVGVTLSTFTATLLEDTDLKERLRIHGIIGDVLASECQIPSDQGKIAAYYLMSPEDVKDLAVHGRMPASPPREWLASVAKVLLSVTLRYEKRPANYTSSTAPRRSREKSKDVFVSVIEFYLMRGANPVRKELTSEIDADYMLSSAREDWLRTRQPVVYKLFPRRAD